MKEQVKHMTSKAANKKPLILIVEDEKILSDAYSMILQAENYAVHVASDGKQALDYIAKHKPDLILLDLRMPVMSGIEFLENAKLSKNYPDIPVIVFSNYDVQKDIDQAYNLGATRYILKAWAAPKELARIVKQTLEDRDPAS
jgi:CheY-like chemotaxis protein